MTLKWKRANKTETERLERIQTHMAFVWLSERSDEKTLFPKTF